MRPDDAQRTIGVRSGGLFALEELFILWAHRFCTDHSRSSRADVSLHRLQPAVHSVSTHQLHGDKAAGLPPRQGLDPLDCETTARGSSQQCPKLRERCRANDRVHLITIGLEQFPRHGVRIFEDLQLASTHCHRPIDVQILQSDGAILLIGSLLQEDPVVLDVKK
eukprot:CAMPEP_0171109356 /NCGR_PEP_ID=MMETSP0766_2-20121228/70729_1 /TAXON_ID=439317 /ORGANISM="Gambierdiscus australes, Strain CAWD 149" /LENGTH=164 /DNA_ID=CAMNT_0011571083 /DNA_START=522 /DNA_END=1016 /DNA_ORIENTATION=+